MIRAIGIDSVETIRFINWQNYKRKQLLKLYHAQEIDYCLQEPAKSAERFAVRFAAKEAFYKAFSGVFIKDIPLYTVARAVTVQKQLFGSPLLMVNWPSLIGTENPPLKTHVSLTHTKTVATALVIIEKIAENGGKS